MLAETGGPVDAALTAGFERSTLVAAAISALAAVAAAVLLRRPPVAITTAEPVATDSARAA